MYDLQITSRPALPFRVRRSNSLNSFQLGGSTFVQSPFLKSMTATYKNEELADLRFQYPENWELIESQPDPDHPLPRAITLESPGGYIVWAVHLHAVDADMDKILDESIDTLRDTYADLELSTETLDFDQFAGKAFGALFFCLDFLIRVKLQIYETPDFKMMLWYQCEDRDFDQQQMVFRAIATTLMQSLSDA